MAVKRADYVSNSTSLVPIEQKTVDFYGDDLTAIRASDGRIYAGLTQMCNALGIDSQGQRRRIERHAVLTKGLQGVDDLSTPGGVQRGYVLRIDLVPLWLSGVRVSAVREEVRPKLEKFQEEAATVLWEAFQEGRLTTDPTFEELLQEDTDAVQAYKMALAVVKLARNQVMLESRLEHHEQELAAFGQRLDSLEADLGGTEQHITEEQASQISQAVKAVAITLGKKTKRNEFGAIYGELYRRYGLTSYKLLPRKQFEDAMNFLTEWHQSLVDDVPF